MKTYILRNPNPVQPQKTSRPGVSKSHSAETSRQPPDSRTAQRPTCQEKLSWSAAFVGRKNGKEIISVRNSFCLLTAWA